MIFQKSTYEKCLWYFIAIWYRKIMNFAKKIMQPFMKKYFVAIVINLLRTDEKNEMKNERQKSTEMAGLSNSAE